LSLRKKTEEVSNKSKDKEEEETGSEKGSDSEKETDVEKGSDLRDDDSNDWEEHSKARFPGEIAEDMHMYTNPLARNGQSSRISDSQRSQRRRNGEGPQREMGSSRSLATNDRSGNREGALSSSLPMRDLERGIGALQYNPLITSKSMQRQAEEPSFSPHTVALPPDEMTVNLSRRLKKEALKAGASKSNLLALDADNWGGNATSNSSNSSSSYPRMELGNGVGAPQHKSLPTPSIGSFRQKPTQHPPILDLRATPLDNPLPPGWIIRGPNEKGRYWYEFTPKGHTQFSPPTWLDLNSLKALPVVSGNAERHAAQQWKEGEGELPPDWDYETNLSSGEIYFITPVGRVSLDDPRIDFEFYKSQFAEAEGRGVNLAQWARGL